MALKGYSTFPKAPEVLEPHHQIVLCHIQDTRWWGVLPLCRGAVGIFYSPSWLGNNSLESEISAWKIRHLKGSAHLRWIQFGNRMHYMDANQTVGEETWRQLHKNVESNIEQVLATTPHETPTVRPPASHHENYTGQASQTRRTLLEKQRRARKWCTPMDPHIWPSKSRTTSPNLHTAAMWGHRM